jgi:predicted membrane protein
MISVGYILCAGFLLLALMMFSTNRYQSSLARNFTPIWLLISIAHAIHSHYIGGIPIKEAAQFWGVVFLPPFLASLLVTYVMGEPR